MRIKKVINNNILCVVDDKGSEMIVTGKGLGFQRKIGERVDPTLFEKTYHMEGKSEQRKLRELCEQIPIEHLRLTQDLIEYIKSQITAPLNESLLITLADHISFAIKRKENGIEFTNPLEGAIMSYYPTEYHLGRHCLQMIQKETQVNLNPSEAAFITMHIVNAEYDISLGEAVDITHLIDQMLRIVRDWHRRPLDETSVDFDRFVTHLKFLAQRALRQDRPPAGDRALYDAIAALYPGETACAHRVGAYLGDTHSFLIGDLEAACLAIHIRRVTAPDA